MSKILSLIHHLIVSSPIIPLLAHLVNISSVCVLTEYMNLKFKTSQVTAEIPIINSQDVVLNFRPNPSLGVLTTEKRINSTRCPKKVKVLV